MKHNSVNKKNFFIKDFICIFFLFSLSALYFYPVWLQKKVFLPADFLNHQYPWGVYSASNKDAHNLATTDAIQQHFPWRLFYQRNIRKRIVPLWNPHQFCGTPFAANDQSAIFYPLNFLFYKFFDADIAYTLNAWLHLWLSGVFMFLFLRSEKAGRGGACLGAIVFMFNGCHIVRMSNAAAQAGSIWAPLVFLFASIGIRNSSKLTKNITVWLCALIIGVMLTAGFLQYASFTLFAVGLFFIYHLILARSDKKITLKILQVAIVSIFCGIAIAAVHVWQVFDLAPLSIRRTIIPHNGWFPGLPFKHLINIIMPDYYGNPVDYNVIKGVNYVEVTFFISLIALIFCVFAVFHSIVSACGTSSFVRLLPNFLHPSSFASTTKRDNRNIFFFVLLWLFAIAAMLGTPLYGLYYYLVPGAKTLLVSRIGYLFTFSSAVLAGLGLNTIYSILRYRHLNILKSSIITMLAIGGTAISILIWGIKFNAFCERSLVFPPTREINFLQTQKNKKPLRVFSGDIGWTLFPNTATALELDDIRGYDSLYPARCKLFLFVIQQRWGTVREQRAYGISDAPTVYFAAPLDWINMRYLLTYRKLNVAWYLPVYTGSVNLYFNQRAYDRVFFSDGWQVIHDSKTTLEKLTAANYKPLSKILLEKPPVWIQSNTSNLPASGKRLSSYQILRWTTNEIHLNLNAVHNTLLFISDTYYPGWQAQIDDTPIEILRGNYNFRTVAIPKGHHKLKMWFSPLSARLGIVISLLTLGTVSLFTITALYLSRLK